MSFCPCAGCHLSLAAFLKIIANRNKCQTICFMCDCSDLPRECACQAFHFYCPAVFRMTSCPAPSPLCQAPCDCCNICALHKAAAYSVWLLQAKCNPCYSRNLEQQDDTPPATLLARMGHVTHVLACRLPPMLLLAFRIAFVLLHVEPCQEPPPCAPPSRLLARISFLGCQVRHISQFMSSFSSKYLHQLRATVVMHMPGLSSFVLLHIYIL